MVGFVFCLFDFASSGTYESLNIINSSNLASYFNNDLGYLYESHGCLHFTPPDIYLLTKTIAAGTPLYIKKYSAGENDAIFSILKTPFLADITQDEQDINKHIQKFNNGTTELVVYPSLGRLFIMVNGSAYAQVKTLAGPPDDLLQVFDIRNNGAIEWDFSLSTATDAGNYTVLGDTAHYISNTYYNNTIIPFGAWIVHNNGAWSYQEDNGQWYKLPSHITADLNHSADQREFNYYDINYDKQGKVQSARWGSHDFGKYALLWSKDGKNQYPELGYSAGALLFEQVILIKDLVDILTLTGEDDFDYCVAQNRNFSFYKGLYEFIESNGEKAPKGVEAAAISEYRLYNKLNITGDDYKNVDARLLEAFDKYQNNRLPRNAEARQKTWGLVYYLKLNSEMLKKQAHWYGDLKSNWPFWRNLRIKLREDFDAMGILSLENRQNLLEKWLNERLEFKTVSPPTQAKNVASLSFAAFFRPAEETAVFSSREEAMMRQLINAATGEIQGLNLHSIPALNDYNFGVLLNDILGDLYKSHGCLHISPRNMLLLSRLLPLKTKITVHDYSQKYDERQIKSLPDLADIANFQDDLEKLKVKFAVTAEVKVAVYPSSGFWIFYLKDKPFAKMQVKGGPQTKMFMVQDRDAKARPIFEDHLAYPTSPGQFRLLKKVEDYVSNIYYDTTIIPMGGAIKRQKNKWVFQNQKGEWRTLPQTLAADLSLPEAQRKYTFYDAVTNPSGESISVKWGSHPFGKYAMQTTIDGKNAYPELIHSSGDLIMEERQLLNDLIKVLSAPYDSLDECVEHNPNFDLYKACYDFVANPTRAGLLQRKEAANYRLYYGLPLSAEEIKIIPPDAIIADKILRNKAELTPEEIKIAVDEDIAYWRGGKLKVNMEKVLGISFDTYQYVVTIQKFAHHYEVLKNNWSSLNNLRWALLKDFNNFVIKDEMLFSNILRELMLRRIRLERLTQQTGIEVLKKIYNAQN